LFTDAWNLAQILDTGLGYALESAEVLDKLTAPLGANPCDLLKRGSSSSLGAPLAVTGDGKAMGFIADLLDQVQCWRIRW
jgi:hypothetical protein